MAAILDSIRERFQTKQKQDVRSYSQLVAATADGEDLDESLAIETLSENHKSPDDLARDVERLRQRKADHAVHDGEPKLKSRVAELGEAIEAAKQKYDAAVMRLGAELDGALKPLHTESDSLRGQAGKAHQARQRLRQTCSAELKNREQQLLNQKHHEVSGHAELNAEIQRYDYGVRRHGADPKRHERPEPNADIESMRKRLAESKAAAARIDKELDDLHAEMLKP